MFAKLLLMALLGVVALGDSTSLLRVIDNSELKKLQKNPRILHLKGRTQAYALQPQAQRRYLPQVHSSRTVQRLLATA